MVSSLACTVTRAIQGLHPFLHSRNLSFPPKIALMHIHTGHTKAVLQSWTSRTDDSLTHTGQSDQQLAGRAGRQRPTNSLGHSNTGRNTGALLQPSAPSPTPARIGHFTCRLGRSIQRELHQNYPPRGEHGAHNSGRQQLTPPVTSGSVFPNCNRNLPGAGVFRSTNQT